MLLHSVLVRFYKSFNYDYLRKSDRSVSERRPWESFEDKWFPYVRIPIEPSITTIVGENESGKSCLLTAIHAGVSGGDILPKDFCRHSEFFTVEEGKQRVPQFGSEWTNVSPEERDAVTAACKLKGKRHFSTFWLFRPAPDKATVYVPSQDGFDHVDLPAAAVQTIPNLLPAVFSLNADVALPESVPIAYLAAPRSDTEKYAGCLGRFDFALANEYAQNRSWFDSPETVANKAAQISSLFKSLIDRIQEPPRRSVAGLQLAHDLIRKIARVDRNVLAGLQEALTAGEDAYAEGIIRDINRRLDTALNFPKVWAQDRDLRLMVSPRDRDLVFTVQDRTGTQYAFGERSDGLRYFLSYYIQYLSHEPVPNGRSEILVMDEPDAYLSNQGQQDLLKVFHSFAYPERDGRQPVQVVYVTHSPFLIDRNHADRIRVLQKGSGDEGTRVVRDVSRNHYEPLRSAFGAFVAETTFIGNCNLMVEGTSDQVLLAGATRHLRSLPDVAASETLDLNGITIVPTGGAAQIPYLVFVALGRDVEQPTVIVLLDSDEEGNAARDVLLNGVGLRGRRAQLLKGDHIVQIGDVHENLVETEDLVPLELAVAATRTYVKDYCSWDDDALARITRDAVVEQHGAEPQRVFAGMREFVASINTNVHMQKVGFARAVVAVLQVGQADGIPEFEARMKALLRRLNQMQRRAMRERAAERIGKRFEREKDKFLQDYPDTATREQVGLFLETAVDSLDDSLEGDQIRTELKELRREFTLEEEVTRKVEDYNDLKERLVGIRYAPLRAVQEKEPDEAPSPTADDAAGEDAEEAAALPPRDLEATDG